MGKHTPEDRAFLRQEFIGMDASVTSCHHPGYLGISGKVVDETMGTIHIGTDTGVKIIPKQGNTFNLSGREIDGRTILFRPEERIKKIR